VLAIVVAIALSFPYIAKLYARTSTENEIASLREQLAQLSVAGGDQNAAEQIRQRIRSLTATAENYGSELDLGTITLSGCDAMQARIESEWLNYTTTVDTDAVKRNNTRATILSNGQTLSRCFDQAITDADSTEALQQIRRSIIAAIAKSEARRVCFESGAPGCSRYGLNEPHGFERAADERDQVQAKLRANLVSVNAKIGLLGGGATFA
jgi:hypothetical protein